MESKGWFLGPLWSLHTGKLARLVHLPPKKRKWSEPNLKISWVPCYFSRVHSYTNKQMLHFCTATRVGSEKLSCTFWVPYFPPTVAKLLPPACKMWWRITIHYTTSTDFVYTFYTWNLRQIKHFSHFVISHAKLLRIHQLEFQKHSGKRLFFVNKNLQHSQKNSPVWLGSITSNFQGLS